MSDVANRLESIAKQKNFDQAHPLLLQLSSIMPRLLDELSEFLRDGTG